MSVQFELLVTHRKIIDEAINVMSEGLDLEKNYDWNNNRHEFVRKYIVNNLKRDSVSPEDHLQLILDIVFKIFHREGDMRDRILEVYIGKCTIEKTRMVRNSFVLLIFHLSIRKVIKFDRCYPSFNFKERFTNNPLFIHLPEHFKTFLCLGSDSQHSWALKALEEETQEKIYSYLETRTAKPDAWSNAVSSVRRFIFSEGVKSFSDITADRLVQYLVSEQSSRSVACIDTLLADLTGNEMSDVAVPKNYRDLEANEQRKSDLLSSTSVSSEASAYLHFTQSSAKDYCGDENAIVFKRREIKKTIVIGDWSFDRKDLSLYTPDQSAVNVGYWQTTQLDFCKKVGVEASYKKGFSKRFVFLNVYLFDYLPHFFENNDVPYKYPHDIKDFKNALFVDHSITILKSLFDQKIPLPVGLIDFVSELMKHNDTKGSKARFRDVIKSYMRYFDFVHQKFAHIEECSLVANPINKFDIEYQTGAAYKFSRKKKFNYFYWLFFKEYLLVVTGILIELAEKRIKPKSGIVKVDKRISFGDTFIDINEVDLSFLSTLGLKSEGVTKQVYCYHIHAMLLTMSATGLRLANVAWLDVNTFDCQPNEIPQDEDELLNIYVNTDKARDDGFNSSMSFSVLSLLRRVKELRKNLSGVTLDPVWYGDSEDTKWGKVSPLFINKKKHKYDDIYKFLPQIIMHFENVLVDSGLKFETELYYKPRTVAENLFEEIKREGFTVNDEVYFVKYPDTDLLSYTPVTIKSYLTAHSLRKTFDSFNSVLIGAKKVGEIFTGQTEFVVGYYVENTVEEELAIKEIARQSRSGGRIENIASSDLSVRVSEEAKVADKLISEGLNSISGFVLQRTETDIDIDLLLSGCNPSDIAINRTHICPFNNECPSGIEGIDPIRKNCALCPVSISTKFDAPAIGARIKYLCDKIKEINEKLSHAGLIPSEIDVLSKERFNLLDEASSWYVRHNYLNSLIKDDGVLTLSGGDSHILKQLKYIEPKNESEAIIARMHEVSNDPMLQSDTLKKVASRLSRKLLRKLKDETFVIPEANEVQVALSMINKIAHANDLSIEELPVLIKDCIHSHELPLLGEL
ncbi:hypothetical protein [Neptuniibacter sp.]|uniref:hypothetical protein n=1 Tax=Neptuniibacter sp. TaxID=1962643 RepID=UPI003B5CCE99